MALYLWNVEDMQDRAKHDFALRPKRHARRPPVACTLDFVPDMMTTLFLRPSSSFSWSKWRRRGTDGRDFYLSTKFFTQPRQLLPFRTNSLPGLVQLALASNSAHHAPLRFSISSIHPSPTLLRFLLYHILYIECPPEQSDSPLT
jgi:hypothetical protein